jgi:hypothetical protein
MLAQHTHHERQQGVPRVETRGLSGDHVLDTAFASPLGKVCAGAKLHDKGLVCWE